MSRLKTEANDISDSDEGNKSTIEEYLDKRDDKPNPEPIHPQRKNFCKNIKDESQRFFLLHAIVIQVLSVEAYKRIDWIKVAKDIGLEGPKSNDTANNLFQNTWKPLHGGKGFLEDKRSTAEENLALNSELDLESKLILSFSRCSPKNVYLLLAMIDELAGHLQRPRVSWTRIAPKLGWSLESGPRRAFVRLWGKYMKIHYPDLVPEKNQSRAEKMAEWVTNMHSFDNGEDDEEPPPPYEKDDSSAIKTEQQNKEADCEMMDLVPGESEPKEEYRRADTREVAGEPLHDPSCWEKGRDLKTRGK